MDLLNLLEQHSLFSHLTQSALYRLVQLAQVHSFRKGDLILQEGSIGVGCYIILSGKVTVIKGMETTHQRRIAELGEGEIIGEMSVIDDEPYSTSVRALEDTQCIMIERWDFKAQMQAYPEIALQLLPILAKRLRTLLEYPEGR